MARGSALIGVKVSAAHKLMHFSNNGCQRRGLLVRLRNQREKDAPPLPLHLRVLLPDFIVFFLQQVPQMLQLSQFAAVLGHFCLVPLEGGLIAQIRPQRLPLGVEHGDR